MPTYDGSRFVAGWGFSVFIYDEYGPFIVLRWLNMIDRIEEVSGLTVSGDTSSPNATVLVCC